MIAALILSWLILLYCVQGGIITYHVTLFWLIGSTVALFLQTVAVAKAVPAAEERAKHGYFALLLFQTPFEVRAPDGAAAAASGGPAGLAGLVEDLLVEEGLTVPLLAEPDTILTPPAEMV